MKDLDLIERLADGAWHQVPDADPGALARRLGTTYGLETMTDPRRGLRLRGGALDLLDPARLGTAFSPWPVHVHPSLDSTNRWLLDLVRQGGEVPALCLAEHQSAGRGRHGRRWVSPYGRNLYLSLAWRFPEAPAEAGLLPLACGAALARWLEGLGVTEIGLKWPNDLVWHYAKLGGLLLETAANGRLWIVGLGLDIDLPVAQRQGIEGPLAQLKDILGPDLPSRTELAIGAARALEEALEVCARGEAEAFLDLWMRYDILHGRQICLHQGGRLIKGRCLGVDAHGALRLATPAGERRLYAGEIEGCRPR